MFFFDENNQTIKSPINRLTQYIEKDGQIYLKEGKKDFYGGLLIMFLGLSFGIVLNHS
jgi:hypothetical protein